jgi:hypothetical protein
MAQIKKKFLASNAVDGTKVQYSNNESFRAKSSSNVDVELFKLDNSNIFQFLQMPRVGSDPSNGNDVSRKSYVDAQVLAEAASRVQADAAETAAREAAIASEAASRQAADEQLASDLADESAARVAAVSAEQSARESADSDLQDAIDAEEAARIAAVSAEESRATAAEGVLQAAITAEQSRAEAAEADLQDQIDALDTGNAQALADEVAARIAADSVLDGKIETEKSRIDAILLASDADKDSFAEIVSLINSVDTTNDTAFASYVLSNDAALAQEVSDRQAGDSALQSSLDSEVSRATAAEETLQDNIDAEEAARIAAVSAEQSAREAADSALDSRLDVLEGSDATEGSVAKAEKDAKDYTDAEVSAEQARAEAAEAGLQSAIDSEAARATAAEGDLQDAIDQEVSDRQSAVSGEEAARMAADAGIQSELDATQGGAGLGVDGGYTAPVGSSHLGSAVSLKDADSKLDAAIVAESNARQTAVSNLEQSISDLDAAMTQGFDDAQAYTDSKVAALIDGAPALLDTLNELAAAIGDDENFAGNIMTAVSNEAAARAAADTAEASARAAADTDLQDQLDAEEAARIAAVSAEQSAREAADSLESSTRVAELPRHAKVRYTLTSTDISNGYVDLDHVALGSSCHVFIDRLACHESDDYTVSTVGGVTRVTFSAGFMSSEEGPGEGDLFRCGYMYKNSDQP